jgi:dTDP-4-amino-4,6-dideoxygalactose transaminase
MEVCRDHSIVLIEDCAHTMGAKWKGQKSGAFGSVACFSTQTYKHLNSGEGGLLTTIDPDISARAILHSGSYMLYSSHLAAPDENVFQKHRLNTPNYSGRMDNLRASILRVQLRNLDENCSRWNKLYGIIEQGFRQNPFITLPKRPQHEEFVGSSIQFSLAGWLEDDVKTFINECTVRGVDIKWFGDPVPRAFTSRYDSWRYIENQVDLAGTRHVLCGLCDHRVPLTFDEDDCGVIVAVIKEASTIADAIWRKR